MKKIFISIILLVCSLIVFFIVSFNFYNKAVEKEESVMLSELEVTASEASGKISYILTNVVDFLKLTAKKIQSLKSYDDKFSSIKNRFNSYFLNYKSIFNVWFENKSGELLYVYPKKLSNMPSPSYSKNFASNPYFKKARDTGKLVVTNVQEWDRYGYHYMNIALLQPIFELNGAFDGILGLFLNLKQLATDIKPQFRKLEKKSDLIQIYCLNNDTGFILMSPNLKNVGKKIHDIHSRKFLKTILSGLKNNTSMVYEGINGKLLMSFSRIIVKDKATPFSIIITMPYSMVNAQIYSIYYKLVLLMIFITITVIVVMYTLISREKIIHRQKEKINILEIQLDKDAVQKEAQGVEDTKYFKQLQRKAGNLRKQ